jgi:hypothetical protein
MYGQGFEVKISERQCTIKKILRNRDNSVVSVELSIISSLHY